MAKKRGSMWYTKRAYPVLGKLEKSLRTTSRSRATYLEQILLGLSAQAYTEVLRAFADGRVSVARIAEAWESQRIHELAQSLRTKSAGLGEAIKAALQWKKPDVAETTYERYATGLGHFLKHVGPDTDVAESLELEVIQSFKAARLEEVATNTVNNDLGAVSVLATYAQQKGWIRERPRVRRYAYATRIRYLEREEIARYLREVRPPIRTQLLLLLSTGMRLGESEDLRVLDVRDGNHEMRLSIRDSKTETGVRSVFVPSWAADAVRVQIKESGLSGTDLLFVARRRTIQAEHDRACKAVGIHEYTIHDHRHSAAVALARAGIPLQYLQKQLGHKHIEMTMKYAEFHPDYSDLAPHFDRMGQMMGLSVAQKVEGSVPRGDISGDTPTKRGDLQDEFIGLNLLQ
ncbi:MAG: Tyrosine recombinase XerC [Nitrospira sp.]|nr:Tyrosine recombinase XerC [Nitrospira sp.]